MTTLRQIFAGAFRDAVQRIEESERTRRWEGVRAVAQRVATRDARGDYGWGRALRLVAEPEAAAEPAPIVGNRIARSWDRALAAFAPGAGEEDTVMVFPSRQPHAVVDRQSRMTVRRPGEQPAPGAGGRVAASWDHALKDFTAAR